MARRGSDRDRSRERRGSAPDPVRAATPAAKPSRSIPTAANRYNGQGSTSLPVSPTSSQLRLVPARSPRSERSGGSLPQPTKKPVSTATPRAKPRLQRKPIVAGKRSLDRASKVSIDWKAPSTKTGVDAKRRRAKPDKSAPASPRVKAKEKKPAARSSPKGAQQAKKTGSNKLTDKNYKGYDATAGKPDKLERPNCKERPSDNRSGGGGSRSFIPWC